MKMEKSSVIAVVIMLILFTVFIDYYIVIIQQSIDTLGAFMLLFLNIATLVITYISILFLAKVKNLVEYDPNWDYDNAYWNHMFDSMSDKEKEAIKEHHDLIRHKG